MAEFNPKLRPAVKPDINKIITAVNRFVPRDINNLLHVGGKQRPLFMSSTGALSETSSFSFANVVLPSALAWYLFEDNANDSSGNARNLSETGVTFPTAFATGPSGQVVSSLATNTPDMSSSSLLSAIQAIDPISGNLTFSYWVNQTTNSQVHVHVGLSNTAVGSNDYLFFTKTTGTFVIQGRNLSGTVLFKAEHNVNVVDGLWHHYLIEIGNGSLKLYLDDVLITLSYANGSEATVELPSATVFNAFNSARIGSNDDNGSPEFFLNGSMWNMQIFASVMTTEQRNFLTRPFHALSDPGQSNQLGRDVAIAADQAAINASYVRQWGREVPNNGIVIPAVHPLEDVSPMSSGYSFLVGMAVILQDRLLPGRRILLIPVAQGGTGYENGGGSWSPTGARQVDAKARYIAVEHLVTEAVGLCGFPGERDSQTLTNANAYLAQAEASVADFVSSVAWININTPIIPFGHVPDIPDGVGQTYEFSPVVLVAKKQLADNAVKGGFLNTSGSSFTDKGDDLHFNTASLRLIASSCVDILDSVS